MSKHFFLALGLSAVCGWLPGSFIGVSAQTPSLPDLTEALQNAVCLNDWTTAIQVTNRIMGQENLPSSDRHSYLQLRRQFQTYRAAQTVFDRSAHPQCQAALQATNAPVTTSSTSGLNWEQAAQSFSQTSASDRPRTAADSTRTAASEASVECYELREGDREVANGSISSRWNYDIIQEGSRNRFYLVYWPQNDCTDTDRTGTHSTQNEAYQEFRRWADEQAF